MESICTLTVFNVVAGRGCGTVEALPWRAIKSPSDGSLDNAELVLFSIIMTECRLAEASSSIDMKRLWAR